MKQKWKVIAQIVGLVLLFVVVFMIYTALKGRVASPGNMQGDGQQDAVAGELELAPDFTMVDKDGNEVALSDFLGKPVVINFWASWCGPCKSEMGDFEEVFQEMGEDVIFIMLNATDGQYETLKSAKDFIENEGYTFPVYFDTEENGVNAFEVNVLPTTYFLNKEGHVVTRALGVIDEKALRLGMSYITEETDEKPAT